MDGLLLIVLVIVVVLLGGALTLSLTRRYRALKAIREDTYEHFPLEAAIPDIPLRRLPDADETDEKAYRAVERHRTRVWWSFKPTELSLDTIGHLGLQVIRDVAAVYHPEAERPEFRASARDLMILNLRVTHRLYRQLDRWPLSMVGGVRIDQALWVRKKVKTFQDSTLGKVARHSKVPYRVAKWAWRAYNVTNPVYWGRQALYKGGREGAIRYLLTSIVTYVGEEAVLTYSGRGQELAQLDEEELEALREEWGESEDELDIPEAPSGEEGEERGGPERSGKDREEEPT